MNLSLKFFTADNKRVATILAEKKGRERRYSAVL